MKKYPRNMGTPKTLNQAIQNGTEGKLTAEQMSLVELHVRDYLAQSFAAAILEADSKTCDVLSRLWEQVTGRKIKGEAA